MTFQLFYFDKRKAIGCEKRINWKWNFTKYDIIKAWRLLFTRLYADKKRFVKIKSDYNGNERVQDVARNDFIQFLQKFPRWVSRQFLAPWWGLQRSNKKRGYPRERISRVAKFLTLKSHYYQARIFTAINFFQRYQNSTCINVFREIIKHTMACQSISTFTRTF